MPAPSVNWREVVVVANPPGVSVAFTVAAANRGVVTTSPTSAATMLSADIHAACALLSDVVRVTPMQTSAALTERVAGPVHLKCENLQRTGSFKIRGAYVRIHRLSREQKASGVVAASAGNHAQGVALAAKLLGVRATVFMPESASLPKVAATKAYGADVRLAGTTVDDALAAANEFAERCGSVFVHPFDHPDVVAGQGTVGHEILEQCPDVRTIVVGTGGGGLLAGVASAVKAVRPDVRVFGVQAAGAAAWPPALALGEPVRIDTISTMADGIAVGRAGDFPFAIVRDLVDDIVVVSEESLSRALPFCLERAKLVVEPAGAAPVAALLDMPGRFEPPVVAILSGGNVDPLLMLRILRHGMAEDGRFLRARLLLPDVPGALARLLQMFIELHVNVLDVEHLRTGAALHVAQAEVELQLETRGHEHARAVLDHLTASGYDCTRF